MTFQYDVEDCDVRACKRDDLKKFRKCLEKWNCWLTDDPHSIYNQIALMLKNELVFDMINQCRRINHKSPSSSVGFNGLVLEFIDVGYAQRQLLALRRLTENTQRCDGISIPNLLDDMKEHACLFTRELYVCRDGLPFDPSHARENFHQSMDDARSVSKEVHKHFDGLMGCVGESRDRDDRVDPNIFDDIKSKLGGLIKVNKVTSKFIAHAADASSRDELNDKDREITFNQIRKYQKIVCQVATYIGRNFSLDWPINLVPAFQFCAVENLDKTWIDSANLEKKLKKRWAKQQEKIESWTEGNWLKQLKLLG